MHRVATIGGWLATSIAAVGGCVAASGDIIDSIRSFAPGFIFTTSLAPVLVAGVLASVRHLKSSEDERSALHERAAKLKRMLADAGLPVMDSPSHVVPVFVGD